MKTRYLIGGTMLVAGLRLCAAESLEALKPFPEQGTYSKDGKQYECTLYPGGHEMPAEHRKAGEALAATIAPDKSGKIKMVAAGHSNPARYFGGYIKFLEAEAAKGGINKNVILASACKGGKMCMDWAKECRAGNPRGVDADAQILLLLTSYHNASLKRTEQKNPEVVKMSLDERTKAMKEDLKAIVQAFAKACPNLKLAYVGGDTWRGNSGLEPMVWEEAFAFKQLIEDQIKGDPELAYSGANRKAPWLAWGGYIWENNPPKSRFVSDGVHPSDEGVAFVIERWHKALCADSTAAPWLLPGKKP